MQITIDDGKVCTKCDLWKPLNDFAREKRMRDGHRSACKQCMTKDQKERRLRDPEKYRLKDAAYRATNAEAHRERARRDYWDNREKRTASRKARRHLHRQARNSWNRQWRQNNPELARTLARIRGERRRARKRGAQNYAVTVRDIKRLRRLPCSVPGCTARDIEIDHVIPLSRGGSHGIGNLQPLCRSHNASKGSRLWIEFLSDMKFRSQAAS